MAIAILVMNELKRFVLDGLLVIPDSNEILKDGAAIKLTPKEKEVLLILYRHRGNTVSREQILENVWKSPLGNDSGLTQAISKLRQIFADDPKNPKLIKTIPKLGYQLLETMGGPVEQDARKSIFSSKGPDAAIGLKKFGFKVLLILAGIIIFLLIFNVRIRVEELPG